MSTTNVRYGILPSAPPSLSSLCILCQIPHSTYRVFPCDCSMPVHEECALIIQRRGTFMCPSCMKTYTFSMFTPASSVMGDSIIYQSSSMSMPRTHTEIACRRNKKSICISMFIVLLLVIVGLALYIFFKYF